MVVLLMVVFLAVIPGDNEKLTMINEKLLVMILKFLL
jgi:hypothetical protein